MLFYFYFDPVYNSREDVYVLYLLGGGYGNPPTEMLHYNYGIHPLMGWVIKSLFTLAPAINWYSLALIFAHYLSCTIILTYVIRTKNTWLGWLSYFVLFIVFEGYFLLFTDFTGASVVLTATGLLFLLMQSWQNNLAYKHCIIVGLLFLFASFYRMHTMIFLVGMALPFFVFTVGKKEKWRSVMVIACSIICILLFNQLHQYWYRAKKADWPQEEAYRQRVFLFFNEGNSMKIPASGEKWYPEYQLITRGLIVDTSYMPSVRMDSMYHELKSQGRIHWQLPAEWRKWFFINNRLFFTIVLLFGLLYGLRKRTAPALLLSLIFLAGGYAFLLFKYKEPTYILISSMSFVCFAIFLHGEESAFLKKRIYKCIALGVLIFFSVWGIVRAEHNSKQNKYYTSLFKQQYAEISSHPDKLFIGIGGLQIHQFYLFDVPAHYQLPNYLHAENFISNNYQPTLERFRIHTLKDILSSPQVLFLGEPREEQKKYFEEMAGNPLQFSSLLPEYRSVPVWKIITPSQ